eukprot:1765775-Rhodomonas_salina.1
MSSTVVECGGTAVGSRMLTSTDRGDLFIGSASAEERRSVQGVMVDDVLVYAKAITDEEIAQ